MQTAHKCIVTILQVVLSAELVIVWTVQGLSVTARVEANAKSTECRRPVNTVQCTVVMS